MAKWQLNRPDGPWNYVQYGFRATSMAILDGATFSPPITTAPDPWWVPYAGGSAQTGITLIFPSGTPPAYVPPPDGTLPIFRRSTGVYELLEPDEWLADPEIAAGLSASTTALIAAQADPIDPGLALLPARAGLSARAVTPCNVFCLGDSITEGGNAGTQTLRWVDRLRSTLRLQRPTSGADAGTDTSYIPAFDPSSLWSRFVWTGSGWTTGSFYGPGLRHMTMTGTATGTVTVKGTSIELVGPTSGGLGTFSVKVDGGSATVISAGTPGGDVQHRWSVSLGASGTHTVEVKVGSGTVVLAGIMVYDGDETKGIRVIDAGHSGYRSTDYDPAGDLPKQIADLTPQLAVIALMANDTYATVTAVATYKARLIALGNLFRATQPYTCSVLFLAYPKRGAGGSSVWPDYVQAMKEAAAAVNGGAAFLNLGARIPAYDDYGYPYFADTVHLTATTHGMVADAIADLLVR